MPHTCQLSFLEKNILILFPLPSMSRQEGGAQGAAGSISGERDGTPRPGRYFQAQEADQEEAAWVCQRDVVLERARQPSVRK